MAREKKPMLSIAEVREMVAPDPKDRDAEAVWINPGLTGILTKIERTRTKKPPVKDMFICTLRDATGSAEISMTLFEQCEFVEGDILEVFGKGLRRTIYNGLEQISLGRETEVHKLGHSSEHAKAAAAAKQAAPANSAPAGAPPSSINRAAEPVIYGGTVGMAMKEALSILLRDVKDVAGALNSSEFWAAVHETSSDIIRLSLALEKGKLAPSVKERNRSPEERAAEEAAHAEAEKNRLAAEEAARKAKEAEEASKRRAEPAGKAVDDDVPY
jgi:hypothetical protein